MALSSNALCAKAKAMYGYRIGEEGYSDLCRKQSLSEMVTYLKSQTKYSDVLKDVNVRNVRRRQLEAALNKEYFGDRLPVAIGERPGLQRKPAPDMVLQALKELNSTPEESIYIGDSEVDVATAENSGLLCIGVTWGFREESLLHELGVKHIARKAEDIITIIEELNK